jgi:integrase
VSLFNSERKNRFLNEKYPNESTRSTYASILKSVGKFEVDKNLDVCDFSYSDATELLIGLKKKTFRSLDVAHTIITKYGDWCLEEKYNKTGVNVFKLFTKDDLKQYVHKIAQKNSYITREQLYDYCDQLYNYIDKAMLVLLFEGVKGRSSIGHSFEEIRNFKMTDIMPISNTIVVTRDSDDKTKHPQKRVISVDPKTIEILLEACEEDIYHKGNGEAEGRFAIMPVKKSSYLIRTIDRKGTDDDRISVSNICSRFKNFRQYTGVKFLNPTLVFQSGMFDRCLKRETENGELQSEDFRQMFRDLNLDIRGWPALKEMYEDYKQTKSIAPS